MRAANYVLQAQNVNFMLQRLRPALRQMLPYNSLRSLPIVIIYLQFCR